ncbi:MAG: hypothetical protein ACP5I8_10115 [Phycisphaerae bacterium]
MHVDTGKSGPYVRHLLRDSFRQDGMVKHRTIANIFSCSPEEIHAIKRETIVPLHPAAAGIGTKVFGKGPSRLACSVSPPWRSCGHKKATAAKTQNPLSLQRIIPLQTSGVCWNIR